MYITAIYMIVPVYVYAGRDWFSRWAFVRVWSLLWDRMCVYMSMCMYMCMYTGIYIRIGMYREHEHMCMCISMGGLAGMQGGG